MSNIQKPSNQTMKIVVTLVIIGIAVGIGIPSIAYFVSASGAGTGTNAQPFYPPVSNENPSVVIVNARTWSPMSTPTQSGIMYEIDSGYIFIKSSESGLQMDARAVICSDEKLADILDVNTLYMANGSPYIFKGINAHNGYTNNLYNSIGVVFKNANPTQPNGQKLNGKWYVTPYNVAIGGGNWQFVLSELLKLDNVYIPPPPKSQVVEIDASTWYTNIIAFTGGQWNGIGVKVSPTLEAGTGRVVLDEQALSEKIGHSLYGSNGLPIIFKGINCFYYDLSYKKQYDGTGFLFKHLDGNWYMRSISIGIDGAEANSLWPYTLESIYKMVYSIPV